jgi:hypothetical protein
MEVSGQLHAPAALPQVPPEQVAGWAPEPVSTLWGNDKSFVPSRNRTPPVQPVARRYPASKLYIMYFLYYNIMTLIFMN